MPKVRPALALFLFLFVSLTTPSGSYSYSPGPVLQGDAQASEAATLLDRSYDLAMSKGVGELDRIRLLNNLVIFAPDLAPTKVVKWASTLITLLNGKNFVNNEDLLPASDRMGFKKNAVIAISKVDPDLGMEEFAKLGHQPTNRAGEKPEDVRAYGSRVVFLNYYRAHGHDGLARIQEESAKLVGDKDGAYAFHAVSLLFSELAAKGETARQDINNIFDTALQYYRCPPNVENQDLDFYTFIQNAKPVVSRDQLKRAVNALADHLTQSGCETTVPKRDLYSAVIETSNGTIRVSDKRKALLIRSFSLINEADPGRGMKLKDQYGELANADAPINQVYSTFYKPSPSPDAQTKAEQEGLELALTNGIQKIRDSNPAAALEMAESLKNEDTKTVQIAFVLPTLAQKDLQRMKQLYVQVLTDLGSVNDNDKRTEATLWMTEAAYHADDPDNFQYLATKTFSDALRTFQASYSTPSDQRPVYARPGYRQLTEFVRFAAAHGIRWPLDEVEQLSNDGLKANLLMYAAVGMGHP